MHIIHCVYYPIDDGACVGLGSGALYIVCDGCYCWMDGDGICGGPGNSVLLLDTWCYLVDKLLMIDV